MANTSAAESWPTPVLLSHGQRPADDSVAGYAVQRILTLI